MDIDRQALSDYITARDGFRRAKRNLSNVVEFDRMITGFHNRLFNMGIPLNVAELEALDELVSARLAWVRMNLSQQKKLGS